MKPTADQRAYKAFFADIAELWTSEDGMLLSLATAPGPKSEDVLRAHWAFQKEAFDPIRMKHRFAFREWSSASEWFDGGSGRRSGKLWRTTNVQTEFPVIEYELKIPR